MGLGQAKFDQGRLVATYRGPLADKYEIVRTLGCGAQGTTHLVRIKTTGEELVAKESHDTSLAGRQTFLEEFDKMKGLSHPNCLKIIELVCGTELVGETPLESLYVISEFAKGGDLAQCLKLTIEHQALTEEWIAHVFRQAMQGVAYLHEIGMTHNDLKPDNILVMNAFNPELPSQVPMVTVADFGCATTKRDTHFAAGDPRYQSPEAWVIMTAFLREESVRSSRKLDPRTDVWMMGVTLFELLSAGKIAFLYEPCTLERLLEDTTLFCDLQSALLGDAEIEISEHCTDISLEAADMLAQLFRRDFRERPTAKSVLSHDWFSVQGKPVSAILENFKVRAMKGKTHAILLNALAKRVECEHYQDCMAAFEKANLGHSGSISLDEFRQAMEWLKSCGAAEVETVFEVADIEKSGKLNFLGFMAVTFDWEALDAAVLDRYVQELAEQLNADSSGLVSKADLGRFIGGAVDAEGLDLVFAHVDLDGDGALSPEELRAFLFDDPKPGVHLDLERPAESEKGAESSALSTLRDSVAALCAYAGLSCGGASTAKPADRATKSATLLVHTAPLETVGETSPRRKSMLLTRLADEDRLGVSPPPSIGVMSMGGSMGTSVDASGALSQEASCGGGHRLSIADAFEIGQLSLASACSGALLGDASCRSGVRLETDLKRLSERSSEMPALPSSQTLAQPLLRKRPTDQMSAQSTDVGSRVSNATVTTERLSSDSQLYVLTERASGGGMMERASEATGGTSRFAVLAEDGEASACELRATPAEALLFQRELPVAEAAPRISELEAASARAAALRRPTVPSNASCLSPSTVAPSLEDQPTPLNFQPKASWLRFRGNRLSSSGISSTSTRSSTSSWSWGRNAQGGSPTGGGRWRQCKVGGRVSGVQ